MKKRREEKRREEKRREEKHNTTFLTNLLSFKLFIILLSLTLLFSISCSNKDKTGGDEKTFAYYAGVWWGKETPDSEEASLITINTDGSMIMHNQRGGSAGDITVASTSITKNSDTSYTAIISQEGADIEMNLQLNFTFSSDTQGKFDMIMEQNGVSEPVGSIDITKR